MTLKHINSKLLLPWIFFTMFTIKNAIYVAIMQVWVIVMGVLASGFWCKFSTSSGMQMPFPALLLFNYGKVCRSVAFLKSPMR